MACKRREQRKRAKARKKAMEFASNYSLDCCQPTITGTWPKWIIMDDVVVNEEKRTDMYNNASATIEVTAVKDNSLSYIKERLDRIYWTKTREIQEKFQSPYPKNLKEAKKWLAEGYIYFTDADNDEEESSYCGWEWGKDTSKESQVAYDTLKKSFTDAYDTVSIVTDEATRLKALQDFEAFAIA